MWGQRIVDRGWVFIGKSAILFCSVFLIILYAWIRSAFDSIGLLSTMKICSRETQKSALYPSMVSTYDRVVFFVKENHAFIGQLLRSGRLDDF